MTVAGSARTCPVCGKAFLARTRHQRFDRRECQLRMRGIRNQHDPTDTIHIVIPDTQVKPGVPLDHLSWVSRYARERADRRPDARVRIIHLGDHWDMPSLSSYDKGKLQMEGRRYLADVEAGRYGFGLLDEHLTAANITDKVYLRGNHEHRVTRTVEDHAEFAGLISLDDLAPPAGWQTYGFLDPVLLDGVTYAHYFYNPMTGRPYSGENTKLRLKNIGRSFTMGHQQTFDHAIRYAGAQQQHGLILGACYLHDEDYKGPQGNAHWRGIAVKFNVRDGAYDPMFVSLDSLCRRYEGVPLGQFAPRVFAPTTASK